MRSGFFVTHVKVIWLKGSATVSKSRCFPFLFSVLNAVSPSLQQLRRGWHEGELLHIGHERFEAQASLPEEQDEQELQHAGGAGVRGLRGRRAAESQGVAAP
jgi:hypothetical protein